MLGSEANTKMRKISCLSRGSESNKKASKEILELVLKSSKCSLVSKRKRDNKRIALQSEGAKEVQKRKMSPGLEKSR